VTSRRRGLAAATITILLTVLPAAPPRSQAALSDDCAGTSSTPAGSGQSASRRPVIAVHGWGGKPLTKTTEMLRKELGDRISTFTFDYFPWSLHWASDKHIAPCLAQYINDVSQAHDKAGGDGKVVLVTHSMGGLATRYAALPADKVLQVITLGTPHLGSPLGGTAAAGLREALLTHLGREDPPGASGGHCLAWHEKGAPLLEGCGPLPPYLPPGVTVSQIAGDITVDRTLFGFHLYSLPLSTDGVVPVSSAHGYATSGAGSPSGAKVRSRSDPCRADFALLYATAGKFNVPTLLFDYITLQDLQRGDRSLAVNGLSFVAMFIAACGHLNLPADPKAIGQVVEMIKELPAAVPRRPKPATDPSEVRFDGIGEFSLALTAADLLARGYVNKGNLYEGPGAACVRYARDGHPLGFSVEASTGRVLAISNASGDTTLHTQAGNIHVNSTLNELRTAFAGHQIEEHLDHDFGQGTNGVIVNGPGGAIAFSLAEAPPTDYASGRARITYLNGVGTRGHAPTSAEDGC
jgi:pimeloyl-ACP methyl ester carboxylesterase